MKTTICAPIGAFRCLCMTTFLLQAIISTSQTTVQVGPDETYVNASVPIEPYYGYSYTQTIIDAADLTAAGLQNGSVISALIYEYSSAALTNSDNWDIYIGLTSKSTFADVDDWIDIGLFQEFALGTMPAISPGVSPNGVSDVRITADAPFVWNGSSNIVIAVDENAPNYGSPSDDFYCHSTGASKSLTYYSDGINPNPAGPPPALYVYEYIPNLRVIATDVLCASLPFSLNFEGGSTWSTDWTVNSGGTLSASSGPEDATVFGADVTSNASSSNYAYCEVTGNFNTEFTMTSNCFDFSSVSFPELTFAYHAYGADIGDLSFEFSTDQAVWTPLWSVSGQQNTSTTDPANQVYVDLLPTASLPVVYFRFRYLSGNSYRGDVAIDDILIDQRFVWLGTSPDWHDVNNWSTGELPDYTDDIVFSSTALAQPSIENATAYVNDITMAAGTVLNIKNGKELVVNGNWINDGTLSAGNGIVTFSGSEQNVLNGVTQDFYSMRVTSAAGIELQSGTYNIYGALYPDGGTIVTKDNLVIASNSNSTGRIMALPNQCTDPKQFSVSLFDSYGDGWNGASLNVLVDGSVSSNYTIASGSAADYSFDLPCGSDVSFDFISGSWDTEITYSISLGGSVAYSSGTYSSNTGNDATGIYAVSNAYLSPFDGDVTVQQYLSTTKMGWREFTCGVENMTLQDFSNDGIYMTGFWGSSSTGPGFTSVYSYDETLANGDKNDGWTPATSITNPTSPSSAHRMYLGANTFNLDFKGTPGYGTYHFSLSYQNAISAETAAPEDQKGWNFIGNPYPCPISWDALTKVNIDDQIWIYSAENGNYGLYVGGAGSGTGTNSVDREIPAHQGVWVHANAYGASINITEAAKQDVSASFVKSQTESPFFKIRLTNSSNAYQDEVILGQDPDATFGYDVDKDGYKLFTNVSTAPSLWMLADTVPVTLNKVKVDDSFEVILHYSSSVIGSHTLLFTNPGVMNFDGCLVLEDMELNVFTPIVDSLAYSFNSNPLLSSDDRFKLHYYPTSAVVATGSACHGGIDGEIAIEFGGMPPFSATLTSSAAVTTVFNDSVGVFAGLLPGSYELEVGGGKGCAREQFQLEIADPAELQIAQDVTNVTSGCDGAIRLNAMGGQSPYTYYIDGVEGNSQDSLCAGSYDVVVVDANSCSTQETIELSSGATEVTDFSVHSFAVLPNPSEGQFRILSEGNSHIRIYSVTGQIVRELKFNSTKMIDMTGVDKGVYIVRDMETGDMMEIVLI